MLFRSCNSCGNYFSDKQVSVDHIIPAGTLTCFEDLPEFTRKLFCEVDGLQVLCDICHTNKSALEALNKKKPNDKKISSSDTPKK